MKKLFALVAFAIVLIAGTLTAYATSNDNENTAAKFVPSDAVGFATLAIDPSVSQKAKLAMLSQRMPDGFKGDDANEQSRELIDKALSSDGLDFDKDIRPWLGSEAAGALLRPADGSKTLIPIAYLKVKDEKAARAMLNKNNIDKSAFRFAGGFLVMVNESDVKEHQGAKALDAATNLIQKGGASLASNPRYKKALATMHNEHIALAWFDLPAILDITKAFEPDPSLNAEMASMMGFGQTKALQDEIKASGAIIMQAYVRRDSVIFRMTTEKLAPGIGTGSGELLKRLPANTVAAATISDFDPNEKGGVIEQLNAAIKAADSSSDQNLPGSDFGGLSAQEKEDAKLGIDLLKTLKGDVVVAAGQAKISDITDIPYGAVATSSDPAATTKAISAIAARVAEEDGVATSKVTVAGKEFTKFQVGAEETAIRKSNTGLSDYEVVRTSSQENLSWVAGVVGNNVYVSNTTEYAESLVTGKSPTLGVTGKFGLALGETASQPLNSAMFIDIESAVNMSKQYQKAQGESIDKDAQAWLDSMKVSGTKYWTNGKSSVFEMSLVFK